MTIENYTNEEITVRTAFEILMNEFNYIHKLKSHIVDIDNEKDNGDDYYFIVFEKTEETRKLLEELK